MEFHRGPISSEHFIATIVAFIPDLSSSSSPTPDSQEHYRCSNRDNSIISLYLHFSTARLLRLKRVATAVEQAHFFVKGLLTAHLLEGQWLRKVAMVRKIPPKTTGIHDHRRDQIHQRHRDLPPRPSVLKARNLSQTPFGR